MRKRKVDARVFRFEMGSSAWFSDEICSMMYVFGDSRTPSVECAAIVEAVVKRQLTSLISAASNSAEQRG